ncbi:hypothetical protein T484DRAFT_1776290, partial [Baffinella frigidus]
MRRVKKKSSSKASTQVINEQIRAKLNEENKVSRRIIQDEMEKEERWQEAQKNRTPLRPSKLKEAQKHRTPLHPSKLKMITLGRKIAGSFLEQNSRIKSKEGQIAGSFLEKNSRITSKEGQVTYPEVMDALLYWNKKAGVVPRRIANERRELDAQIILDVARQLIHGLMVGHRERRRAAKIGNMRLKLAMQSRANGLHAAIEKARLEKESLEKQAHRDVDARRAMYQEETNGLHAAIEKARLEKESLEAQAHRDADVRREMYQEECVHLFLRPSDGNKEECEHRFLDGNKKGGEDARREMYREECVHLFLSGNKVVTRKDGIVDIDALCAKIVAVGIATPVQLEDAAKRIVTVGIATPAQLEDAAKRVGLRLELSRSGYSGVDTVNQERKLIENYDPILQDWIRRAVEHDKSVQMVHSMLENQDQFQIITSIEDLSYIPHDYRLHLVPETDLRFMMEHPSVAAMVELELEYEIETHEEDKDSRNMLLNAEEMQESVIMALSTGKRKKKSAAALEAMELEQEHARVYAQAMKLEQEHVRVYAQ